MFVAKKEEYLPEISLSELKKAYDTETCDKAKLRLKCALLRKKGESIPSIALATGKRESTVSDILRRFSERGLDASHAIKQSGQPKKMSSGQIAEFKIALLNPPVLQDYPFVLWSTSLIEYYINEKFGVSIGRRQISRILKGLGFTPVKISPELLEANEMLQKKFGNECSNELKKLFHIDKRSPGWTRTEKEQL
jgi:transposase